MRFNPNNVDMEAGKIKKDWYSVVIEQAWESETKNGKGRYVQLDLIITTGEHKGIKLKDFIIYQHESEAAEQIGSQRLVKVCDACGLEGELTDETVLRNKTLEAYLVPVPDSTFPEAKDYRESQHKRGHARGDTERQVDVFDDLPEDIPRAEDDRPPANSRDRASRPQRASRANAGGAVR